MESYAENLNLLVVSYVQMLISKSHSGMKVAQQSTSKLRQFRSFLVQTMET